MATKPAIVDSDEPIDAQERDRLIAQTIRQAARMLKDEDAPAADRKALSVQLGVMTDKLLKVHILPPHSRETPTVTDAMLRLSRRLAGLIPQDRTLEEAAIVKNGASSPASTPDRPPAPHSAPQIDPNWTHYR